MRTLVIAGEYPWPVNSGSRLRLLSVLRGLRRCGPVELFSVLPRVRADIDPPDRALGLSRVGRIGYDNRPASGWRRFPALARPGTPLELPGAAEGSAPAELARFATGPYDLVWYFGVRAWVLAGGLEAAPAVIDLDDLEDRKIAARLAVPRSPAGGLGTKARRAAARALSEEEMRRWRRLYRRAGDRATVLVVCSELDAERCRAVGLDSVAVVPNGYRPVERPLGRVEVGAPPTLLFPGTLRYPPNADAARYLVDEVGPAVRALVPDARIRLVGRTTPEVSALDDPPRVTVVGQVPDIDPELAGADVVVVPVRFGSGTRLKIVEAFAHRIPVVSTALGAEGLEATDDQDLLIADRPSEMASACARLLTDPALRARLADSAHRLFLEHFQDDLVEQAVVEVAARAARP